MWEVILDTCCATVLGIFFTYLLLTGRKQGIGQHEGWSYILAGFSLILFGMIIGITDNLPGLNRFIIIGSTKYEALLEKVAGFLFGFMFLAIGFIKWMPMVVALKETERKLERSSDALKALNEKLQKDIVKHEQTGKALLNAAQQWRSTFDSISDFVSLLDLEGNILRCNMAMKDFIGKPFNEILNRPCWEMLLGTTMPIEGCPFSRMKETLRRETTNFPFNNRWFNVSVDPIRDEAGSLIGAVNIISDITQRMQAEEALYRSEEESKALARENAIMAEIGRIISSSLDINEVYERFAEEVKKLIPFDRIVINTINIERGTVINVYMAGEGIANRKVGKIYPLEGSGNAEMVRTESTLLIQTEDFNEYRDRFPMLLSTFQAGFRSIMNVPLFSKGRVIGGLLLRSFKPFAYTDKDVKLAERIGDQIAGAVANAQLFAEHKRAEEELRENEERLQGLMDASPIGISWSDMEGNIKYVNRKFSELFGYTVEDIPTVTEWRRLAYPDPAYRQTVPLLYVMLREAQKQEKEVLPIELTIACKDGSIRYVEQMGAFVTNRMMVMYKDITERKRAEEALRESEDRYRDLVEHSQDLICTHDLKGKILSMNQAAAKLMGYEKELLLRMNIQDILAPEVRDRFKEYLNEIEKQGETKGEMLIQTKTGEKRVVEYSNTLRTEGISTPIVRSMAHDITERRQAEKDKRALEEQLRQSQKMEAVGQLAGGVAHDFNNLLTVIQGYCDLILKDLDEKNRFFQDMQEIKKASEHATSLTRQLLAFSRKQILQPKILDLNDLVLNMDKMLRRLIGEDIELVTLLSKDLGRVKADPGQIEQVIFNLAVNARDAMPKGGKLTIETADAELDEHYARSRIGVKPGRYVRISVSDNGIGMPSGVKDRIFEPFFTTKEKGKGTGLGLSTVYGIVKQSGGNVWVYSEPNQGTTFKIYLPMIEEAADFLSQTFIPTKPFLGTETILLVEDEEAVRKLASTILQSNGYKVLEAGNGEEALRIAQEQNGNPIHLILTDVVMPGMSGSQLAERLVSQWPEMKVLYMSGYTDNAIVHHGILDQGKPYIQKPFNPSALAEKVRDILDGT
jgi:PAS domain S-box-containing protein